MSLVHGRLSFAVLNLANILTILRILLTFVFLFFILQEGFDSKILAAFVFIVAAITDFLDGYCAKKYNLVSDFGKLMDPIADKFLMLSAFFIFWWMMLLPAWMFLIILFREVFITGFRLFAVKKGKVLAAEKAGKYKTVAQIFAIIFTLFFIVLKETQYSVGWSDQTQLNWEYSIYTLMLIAVSFTLVSGVMYLRDNRKVFHVG